MTIGQVAQKAGVTQSAIRYYEATGLLPQPSRKHGVRQYDDGAVDQVKILRFLRRSGITIRRIAAVTEQQRKSNDSREVWLGVFQRRIAELDALIVEAHETKRRLEETIACECNGATELCPIFQADGDIAG
ncbi:MAG TPA: MerR family transcriptional regulator [Candidatus Eremiobacteraceae bacterium]|jgi:DNA-binding transcriptional MerR regulator